MTKGCMQPERAFQNVGKFEVGQVNDYRWDDENPRLSKSKILLEVTPESRELSYIQLLHAWKTVCIS